MKAEQFFSFYNAADEIISHNLAKGCANRIAVVDQDGSYTYQELDKRINQFANVLVSNGIRQEERIFICLFDTVDFPVCFLGAIRAGVVPIPVNTLLKASEFAYILQDSRARALVVPEELLDVFQPLIAQSECLGKVLVSGKQAQGHELLSDALSANSDECATARTRADDVAFWLYTSGTTGRPKGAMHLQPDLMTTAKLYSDQVLGMTENDVVYSAAKLFFAYGLGNALTFPFSHGAKSVLLKGRPTPEAVKEIIETHRPTLFFGVPTLYAMILNSDHFPNTESIRLCISAGEALPESVFTRWRDKTGLEILDGIGSTEMLHIFISNTEADVKPGTSGKVVPGYEVKILNEHDQPVADGETGDLYVNGPTSAVGYWNKREASIKTFQGRWTHTGDKYKKDSEGYFINCGRSDDLIKVGGIYVSPTEVENALLGHDKVAEAAVVGRKDKDELIKPKAFVVLKKEYKASDFLAGELIDYVRSKLAEYKRPRWIQFIDELPKTATGKIQRFKLRT